MIPPQQRKLLEDMRDAAADIATFTHARSLTDYLGDKQFRWSVERGFEIIGEALTQLRKLDSTLAERLTDYRKIISFRNVLIHGYSQINPSTTWDIIEQDMPVLRAELDRLLKEWPHKKCRSFPRRSMYVMIVVSSHVRRKAFSFAGKSDQPLPQGRCSDHIRGIRLTHFR
jgi:uncharacterized protein with HEPN domain